MRIPAFVRTLPLLIALASPALLIAQHQPLLQAKFQQPTDEELKMSADPKAPGAAAVYLNIEEVDNDPLHYQSFYARIKVLTEKGKDLATVELPYLKGNTKITDIQARTIHSDGTVIPLIVKPADLLIAKTKSGIDELQVDRKVFTLPSVEVGSILEYRYELRYDDSVYSSPSWEIQRHYFIHKAHYVFTPQPLFLPKNMQNPGTPLSGETELVHSVMNRRERVLIALEFSSLLYWQTLPPGTSVSKDTLGCYSVDLTDIPPAPEEEWMPTLQSLLYKVIFYYTDAYDAEVFWVSSAKDWSKAVDHFADPSKSIHDVVNGLIAPGDSDLDKAKKLYKAVQALDNTDFSRKKTESERKQLKLKTAKRAEDTWAQKSGSSEDIALLYLAMLRAAGLKAYAMKVVDRERGLFNLNHLSLDQLDDTLVILPAGENEIILDPGEKMCPFGTLHWRHSDASGLRQGAEGREIASTPRQSFSDNTLHRDADITIDEHGAINGELRFVMTGQEALRWRQTALENDEAEVKKQFDNWMESMVPAGVEAHIEHFIGLDDPDAYLMAAVKVHGALASATSRRLLLPGFFFESRGSHPFVAQEKRQTPVDMHYGEQVIDQVTYHLPAGFVVEGAPQDAKLSWPKHAILMDKTVSAPGQITITRSLARAFTVAKPEEYQDLRGFYQKVAAADQAQLVLTAAPAAPKAN